MNKSQAFFNYLSKFGLPVYDNSTVPTDESVKPPYLTVSYSEDTFGTNVPLYVFVWYRDSSWINVTNKADEISRDIGMGGKLIPYDGGAMWIRRGTPALQRMSDESDDMIRRIAINLEAEFISAD